MLGKHVVDVPALIAINDNEPRFICTTSLPTFLGCEMVDTFNPAVRAFRLDIIHRRLLNQYSGP